MRPLHIAPIIETLSWYTDATPTTLAATDTEKAYIWDLPYVHEINLAECMAAATTLIYTMKPNCKIIIFTDNQSVLKLVNKFNSILCYHPTLLIMYLKILYFCRTHNCHITAKVSSKDILADYFSRL